MEEREKRRADDEKQRYTPKVVFHPVPNSEGVIASPNDKEVQDRIGIHRFERKSRLRTVSK